MGLFNADVSVKDEVLTWLNSWRVKEEPEPEREEWERERDLALQMHGHKQELGQQMAEAHDRMVRAALLDAEPDSTNSFVNAEYDEWMERQRAAIAGAFNHTTHPPSITREDFDRFFQDVMGASQPQAPVRYQVEMTLTEEAYNSYREWEAGQEMGNDILAREITVIQQPVNAYYDYWGMQRYPMSGLCTPSRWGRVTGHRHG